MEVFGSGLTSPAPVGPVQHSFRRRRSLPHQPPEQAPYFGDRQGTELSGFLLWNLGPFVCPATLTAVKNARATMASVICMFFGRMSIPALPMSHFVVIQTELLFGQFNGFFHPALGSLPPVRPAPSWGLSTVGTKSRNSLLNWPGESIEEAFLDTRKQQFSMKCRAQKVVFAQTFERAKGG